MNDTRLGLMRQSLSLFLCFDFLAVQLGDFTESAFQKTKRSMAPERSFKLGIVGPGVGRLHRKALRVAFLF